MLFLFMDIRDKIERFSGKILISLLKRDSEQMRRDRGRRKLFKEYMDNIPKSSENISYAFVDKRFALACILVY